MLKVIFLPQTDQHFLVHFLVDPQAYKNSWCPMPCQSEKDFQFHVPFWMTLQELCGYCGTPGFITFCQTIFQKKFRPLSAAMMSSQLTVTK
jgi:hypothetical protein